MSDKQKMKNMSGFEDQETVGVSPWMLALIDELGEEAQTPHWSYSYGDFTFEIVEGRQSLWITCRFPAGGRLALRAAYCPDGELAIDEIRQVGIDNSVEIRVTSTVGNFLVRVDFPHADRPLLHYKTTLIPSASLVIPFWPRDVIPLGDLEDLTDSEGVIYSKQVGPRSGILYFGMTRPKGGSAFYFQNLTSLNDYAIQTETSLAETVGGEWPELGFALPASTEKALEAGREITISDAFLRLGSTVPADDVTMTRQFVEFLAQVYVALPRMETKYVHWTEVAEKSLRDLESSEKCWSEIRGRSYLNAYVGDYDTPPESMVQLTVLLPLMEYAAWGERDIPLTKEILSGLPHFYNEEAGVLGRWLVSEAAKLDGSEPQKKPNVMDSWYLYHSLLNISRLALRGDETAKQLFLNSLEFAVEVAQKFEYRFPVFYDINTKEVIKAETEEGEGGEMDVAGQYAHVMMQAWDMTKDERYLEEAKRAARSLKGLGFRMFYQANATLFAAGGLLRLWKKTGDEEFLQLSYVALANVFNHMWLWECDYGYAQHYKTFFALFPLKDAPYTAVYEELEGFAALHDYLQNYHGEIPEWLRILGPEFIRNMLYKASFYYPPNLPAEVMTEQPKTGELDPKLWIPLEDTYDGWEQAGQVGQEVYGAGLPFGVIPRHYWRVPDKKFMIYINYPIKQFSTVDKGKASFHVVGDARFTCHLRLIPIGRASLPAFRVQIEGDGASQTLQGSETEEGHIEYTVPGDSNVIVQWEARRSKPRSKSTNNHASGRKGKKK